MTDLAFGAPRYLTLLIAPAALLLLWVWTVFRRGAQLRRLSRRRIVPFRERFGAIGDLRFWFFQIAALTLLILALARPLAPSSLPRRAGLDLVILQDASASMRVTDVGRASAYAQASADRSRAGLDATDYAEASADRSQPPRDRWQRSMQFLRELGDAMSWHEDRVALTVFAHIAAPQIRLTRDPNTLFFFLDHLNARPPFRLEDASTWDTNLELGLGWGLRLIDKDEEIHGRSQNAKLFVVLSDGELWSGEVAKAITAVTARGFPIYVIGVGTLGGGPLPVVEGEPLAAETPAVSRLERAALQRIASAGGGRYFELDRDGDRVIANTIIADGRRLAPATGFADRSEELYWWFLSAAAATAALGIAFLRQSAELAVLLAGGFGTVAIQSLLF